jgi:hypothetical protein
MTKTDLRMKIVDVLAGLAPTSLIPALGTGATVHRPDRGSLLLKLPGPGGPRYFEIRVTEKV